MYIERTQDSDCRLKKAKGDSRNLISKELSDGHEKLTTSN